MYSEWIIFYPLIHLKVSEYLPCKLLLKILLSGQKFWVNNTLCILHFLCKNYFNWDENEDGWRNLSTKGEKNSYKFINIKFIISCTHLFNSYHRKGNNLYFIILFRCITYIIQTKYLDAKTLNIYIWRISHMIAIAFFPTIYLHDTT